MRILINDYGGHAFALDLSAELTRRGHEIDHCYCSSNVTPRGDFKGSANEGVRIWPIDLGHPFEKYRLGSRFKDEVHYGVLSIRHIITRRPEAIVLAQMPIASLLMCIGLARIRRIPVTLWLQDYQSGIVAASTPRRGKIVGAFARLLEHQSIRSANHVIAISEPLADLVATIRGGHQSVTVIENWAPVDKMPLHGRRNSWSEAQELASSRVFLYAGTLGVKHDSAALLQLSATLKERDPESQLVVVSEGSGAQWLRSQVRASETFDNIRFLDFQEPSELPKVLASAEVLVVLLGAEFSPFCVPSKVLSYHCAGRPILGLLPAANPASRLISTLARSGLVADGVEAFCKNAELLLEDAEMREDLGQSGRRWAEREFDSAKIADRFQSILYS